MTRSIARPLAACYAKPVHNQATNLDTPGQWADGVLPPNVVLGNNTVVTGALAFKRFHATQPEALVVGHSCSMDGVHFDLGAGGRVRIGHCCYFTNAVLLCEL